MFNANNSLSKKKILLVLNPHIEKAKIKLDFEIDDSWKIIADVMHFEFEGIHPIDKIKDQNDLVLNGLSVYLLLKDNSNN